MKDWIKYKGMSFNASALAGKTKEEFIEHEKHNFEGNEDQLNELYDLIQKKAGTEPEPDAPNKRGKNKLQNADTADAPIEQPQ